MIYESKSRPEQDFLPWPAFHTLLCSYFTLQLFYFAAIYFSVIILLSYYTSQLFYNLPAASRIIFLHFSICGRSSGITDGSGLRTPPSLSPSSFRISFITAYRFP